MITAATHLKSEVENCWNNCNNVSGALRESVVADTTKQVYVTSADRLKVCQQGPDKLVG